MPLERLPAVMPPEFTIVLASVPLMAAIALSPTEIAPLLLIVLALLTVRPVLPAEVPTVAPDPTFTVSAFCPPPAVKPPGVVPRQVTVVPDCRQSARAASGWPASDNAAAAIDKPHRNALPTTICPTYFFRLLSLS